MSVRGEGPAGSELFFVGEAPGFHEQRQGRPFVGRAGEVLNEALNRASLDRNQCYLTNLVKERPTDKNGKDRAPTAEEIGFWESALEEEARRVEPKIIVTLGATATRYFLPELDAVGGMETVHGMGRLRAYTFAPPEMGGVVVFPCYHPAAGLHDPRVMSDFFWDIQQLGRMTRAENRGDFIAFPDAPFGPPSLDTEYSHRGPYCFTTSAGGFGMFGPNQHNLANKPYGFHNSLADLQVFDKAGMPVQAGDDSMVALYNLNTEPKGLKEAVYRYFDHRMSTFEEVTGAVDKRIVGDWLKKAAIHQWPEWPSETKDVLVKCKFHRKKANAGVEVVACGCVIEQQEVASRKQPIAQRIGTQLANLHLSDQSINEIAQTWKGMDDIAPIVEAALGPMPRATIEDVPIAQVKPYAKADAHWTSKLIRRVKRVMDPRLLNAYEMDMVVIPMIAAMEHRGLLIDRERLDQAQSAINSARNSKLEAVREYTGREDFNPASSDQVAEVFALDGIETGKLTPGGKVSTSKNVLKALKGEYQFAADVYEFREAEKLLNTFIPAIVNHIQSDGRIHPNFRITNTDTGRLSAHAPNLLAFPVRTPLGKMIRACFKAGAGRTLIGADLDQIEMRIMADESQDENLIRAIRAGLDVHADTASAMFNVDYARCVKGAPEEKRFRTPCKSTGFLVIFEGGAMRLKEQMEAEGIVEDLPHWQWIIDRWYKRHPGVKDYQRKRHNEAHTFGYVRDRWGRIRHVEAVWCPDIGISKKAEREASNFPIQAGAQGQIKRSMALIWEGFGADIGHSASTSPLLQIHDELIFEVDEKIVDKVSDRVVEYMSDATSYAVPITASSSRGDYWSDLK